MPKVVHSKSWSACRPTIRFPTTGTPAMNSMSGSRGILRILPRMGPLLLSAGRATLACRAVCRMRSPAGRNRAGSTYVTRGLLTCTCTLCPRPRNKGSDNPSELQRRSSMQTKSLYERLGGYDAMAAVTDDLLTRLLNDPQLGVFWKGHSEKSLRRDPQ